MVDNVGATRLSPLVAVPPLHTPADDAVEADPEIQAMDETELVAGVRRLRAARHAVLLAHNYQVPAVQDVADFVGDSLQLAQQAAVADAELLVLCGVHFMAETAALLNPERRVLTPEPSAGCSLAASVTAAAVRSWRAEHPGAVVVAYVNTDAEVKAEVDYCCTSANATQVVEAIPSDREILFLPDRFLGAYVRQRTGRHLTLWPGECHVHAAIGLEQVETLLARHPDAHLLLHPECGCVQDVLLHAVTGADGPRTFVLSTGGMSRHARRCRAAVDLVGTEVGMLHRLGSLNRSTSFVPVREDAVCSYMKATTLAKLYRALRDEVYEVSVPPAVAERARLPIERMLAVTH